MQMWIQDCEKGACTLYFSREVNNNIIGWRIRCLSKSGVPPLHPPLDLSMEMCWQTTCHHPHIKHTKGPCGLWVHILQLHPFVCLYQLMMGLIPRIVLIMILGLPHHIHAVFEIKPESNGISVHSVITLLSKVKSLAGSFRLPFVP